MIDFANNRHTALPHEGNGAPLADPHPLGSAAALSRAPREPLALTMHDLAVLLQLSRRTIKRMTAEGMIPGVCRLNRCVRFDRRAIEKWVADGCPAPRRRQGKGRR